MNFLNRILLFLFILLLPSQLGLHFWPDFALINGLRIDYLSPVIYFTDVLALLIILLNFKKIVTKPTSYKKFLAIFFIIFIVINILNSNIPAIALLKWVKLTEAILLTVIIGKILKSDKDIYFPVSISLIYTSLLGLFQFFSKKSIGGIFYWLGERNFSISMPSIATFTLFGKEYLRPYSTFSHPNSFAGFILIEILIILSLNTKLSSFYKITLLFSFMSFFLAYSQNAWASLFVIAALYILKLYKKKYVIKTFFLALAVSSVALPLLSSKLIGLDNAKYINKQYFTKRLELNELSGLIISQKPLIGVGLGNFLVKLPDLYRETYMFNNLREDWWIQPVHNVYLLIVSESGLVGFLLFIFIALSIISKNKNQKFNLVMLAIFITAFLDHYWFTLQQNILLSSLVFAIALI